MSLARELQLLDTWDSLTQGPEYTTDWKPHWFKKGKPAVRVPPRDRYRAVVHHRIPHCTRRRGVNVMLDLGGSTGER